MQRQWHAGTAPPAMPTRDFRGWFLPYQESNAAPPFRANPDTHFLYRVLISTVTLTLGSSRALPQTIDTDAGSVFIMRPVNFFSLRNASATACALLFCVPLPQCRDARFARRQSRCSSSGSNSSSKKKSGHLRRASGEAEGLAMKACVKGGKLLVPGTSLVTRDGDVLGHGGKHETLCGRVRAPGMLLLAWELLMAQRPSASKALAARTF